jgi:hypothetical protein
MLIVPLNIVVTPFSERGQTEPSTWTDSDPGDALVVANNIWMPANIQFHLKQAVVFDTPLDLPKGSRTRDQLVLDVLSDRRPAGTLVHVFLINRVQGLTAGGTSYLNSDPEAACFVQQYDNASSSGRALAHELGHLLGLDHVKVDYQNERLAKTQVSNLMVEGLTVGTSLTPSQIKTAKGGKLAKKFGGATGH